MNSYEKLAMILVPSMGLAAILYFFTWYLPDVENGHFNDTQRLQGASYQSKVVYRKTDTLMPVNKQTRPNVKRNNTHKKGYIKWEGKKEVTFMPESLKNRRYKQTSNYIPQPVYDHINNGLQSEYAQKIRLQKQAQARKQKKLDKNINDQECSYYEEMKDVLSNGWAFSWWCENEACEARVKEDTKATARGIADAIKIKS